MATDPVCGMTVDEKSAAGSASHAGQTYFFCDAEWPVCNMTVDKVAALKLERVGRPGAQK